MKDFIISFINEINQWELLSIEMDINLRQISDDTHRKIKKVKCNEERKNKLIEIFNKFVSPSIMDSEYCSRLETLSYSRPPEFTSIEFLGVETDKQGTAVVIKVDNIFAMRLKYYLIEEDNNFKIKSVYAFQNNKWNRYYL